MPASKGGSKAQNKYVSTGADVAVDAEGLFTSSYSRVNGTMFRKTRNEGQCVARCPSVCRRGKKTNVSQS
ncbi:MAG: hypothetical protein EBT07_04100 [Actinobacteria bacterium]|nr:hypothetical protein [Actinomycetota bacterium]